MAHGLKDRLTELDRRRVSRPPAIRYCRRRPAGRGWPKGRKWSPGITVVELAGELEKNKTNLVTIIDPSQPGRRRGTSALLRGHRPGLYDRSGKTPSSQVFRSAAFCILGAYTPAGDEPDQWNPWRERMGRYMLNYEPKTPRGLLTRASWGPSTGGTWRA